MSYDSSLRDAMLNSIRIDYLKNYPSAIPQVARILA